LPNAYARQAESSCSADQAEVAWVALALVQSNCVRRRHVVSVDGVGGDHREFLDATLPYLDVVWQVARHASRDGVEPEDLVQETYLRAYAAFDTFRGGDARSWLAAICMNAARSEARRRRRRPWELTGLLPPDVAHRAGSVAREPDVADLVIASLDAQLVSRCMAKLAEPQRLCMVLVDIAGLTAREAAEALGCPRGTVLARLHRGRRRLAELLTEAGVSYGRA
jgi:RNA polymerase sigma-70 factor (ECF subfamily)